MKDEVTKCSPQEIVEQFADDIRKHGINVNVPIIADGRLHRYYVEGDRRGSRNCWAILHVDDHPAGIYGHWKTGEKLRWSMKGDRSLTAAERKELREQSRLRKAQRDQEIAITHMNAAGRALDLYERAERVESHSYLAAKRVPTCDRLRVGSWYRIDEETGEEILVSSDALIVPMQDTLKQIHSLQAIIPDERERRGFRKQYLKGGSKDGKFMPIGMPRDDVVLICEGLATGLSLWQCTGHAVLVAFDTSNLIHVAREIRRARPKSRIIMCADNDAWTAAGSIRNPGIHYATLAANAVSGVVAVPQFLRAETKPTDFNDLHCLEGEQIVRDMIAATLAPRAKITVMVPDPESDAPDTVADLPLAVPPRGHDAMAAIPGTLGGGKSIALIEPIQERKSPTNQNGDVIIDTDVANARRLAARHGNRMRYTPERGWVTYDGRRWRFDVKGVRVQGFAKDTALAIYDAIKSSADAKAMFAHAKKSQSRSSIENMIVLVRDEAGIAVSLNDFDANTNLLNVANGTLNLDTCELQPHRREDLLSNIVEVPFDCDARCELWDSFLWRATSQNEDLYAYLRRFVGYLLCGDTSDQSLHFLYGNGANGKSVFCEVIMRLLGDYAIAVSPELIMARRYGGIPNDVARLRGVRAALMNETSQGSKFDEAKLKDLTGGDTLNARFLHHEFFDFSPTHKLVIRGNHKPGIRGTDDGIWRRLRLVPFSVQIPPEERDPHLLRKLEKELPGILQWALRGYREWRDDGLRPPAIVTDAVREYRDESDILGRFISDMCVQRPLAQIKSSVFFARYQAFCTQLGERWMQSKDLPHEMQRRGLAWKRTNAGGTFFGVELKENEDSFT